ncbi:MAG: ABC transporter ATP-binding protein [Acidimicrobiales bacterium]
MKAIRSLWPWMRPYWRYAAGAFVAMIISVLINLSIPLLTSRIIDDGIAEDDGSFVLRLALTMIGLIVAGMAASAVASLMGVRLAFNTITDLRRDVYAKTQTFSFGNLDELTSGEILTRLSSDMTKVTMLLSMGLSFIAQIPIMFIGALGAIVLIDASLVVIVLVMIPVIGILVGYTISQSNVLYDAVQRRIDRLNTVLQENIQGAEVIKAFVRQEHETERFNEVADDLADQATKVNQLVASLFPTLIVISAMGISAVLWLGGGNVIEGTLTDGQLVAFISYMALVSMPMMMFAFLQPMISAASASMARINEILETVPAISFVADGINLADQPTPGDIEFDNVSFGYSSRDASSDAVMALHNVSVKIKAGTTVAILGATGSGKSTLVHLIPRLYDTSGGTVRVGGIDVRALTKSSLRRNIGIALQQPELFSGSVADNLRFGRPDATDEQIIAAATAAQAHDFITAMTNGYDSVIQQSGANLSGGQRQRLAIARTLVLEPAILLLDDSTSAVDLETEAHIQTAFEELDGTTVVLVAQRISTALGADEIIVLDEGRIVAHGSHDQLLATSAIYQDIYRSQLGEPADLGQSS